MDSHFVDMEFESDEITPMNLLLKKIQERYEFHNRVSKIGYDEPFHLGACLTLLELQGYIYKKLLPMEQEMLNSKNNL
jgi:hypothetical protein